MVSENAWAKRIGRAVSSSGKKTFFSHAEANFLIECSFCAGCDDILVRYSSSSGRRRCQHRPLSVAVSVDEHTHTRSCRSATHTCSPNEPKRLLCMPCCALIPEHMKRCGKWIFRIHSYFARNKFIVANSMVEMVVNSGAGRRYRTIWRIKFHFRKRKCIGLTVENFIRFKRWWCSM